MGRIFGRCLYLEVEERIMKCQTIDRLCRPIMLWERRYNNVFDGLGDGHMPGMPDIVRDSVIVFSRLQDCMLSAEKIMILKHMN